MMNKPGYSWGRDNHVNLFRSSKGWLAVYYDSPTSRGEIIKVFKPRHISEFLQLFTILTEYNYNTCRLCPEVKLDMDATA